MNTKIWKHWKNKRTEEERKSSTDNRSPKKIQHTRKKTTNTIKTQEISGEIIVANSTW